MNTKNFVPNEIIRSVTTHYWVDHTNEGSMFTISITAHTTNGKLHIYDATCPVPIEQWDSESQVHGDIISAYQHTPHLVNTTVDQCNTPLPNPLPTPETTPYSFSKAIR